MSPGRWVGSVLSIWLTEGLGRASKADGRLPNTHCNSGWLGLSFSIQETTGLPLHRCSFLSAPKLRLSY